MNHLQISNLEKTYSNGVKALDGINLNISNGMFGLLGPNGAGKSSLMRTIATLQKPDKGTIFFNDVDILRHPQYMREHLGFLPQDFGVYPRVSCEKLLHHLAVLKGVSNSKDRKAQVESLLHQTNLYEHRKKAVFTFSGGMKRRFGIAQALLGNPKLIVVDEPTAGLDPEERNRFLNLLSLIGKERIVILSTHIVDDVYDMCSNMAIQFQGRIVSQGKPFQLTADLQNQIWVKTIQYDQLSQYQNAYNVLSTRFVSGNMQVQIWSETNPENGFIPQQPNLESVYFSQLSNINHETVITI